MRKIAIGLLLSSLLGLGLTAGPATADAWRWPDKGGRGPLAIASVTAGHARYGPLLTITFDQPLNPAAMGPRDFVIVDVEADGRGKSERWIYFVNVRGRLRTFYYEPKYRILTPGGTTWSRPTSRSIRLQLPAYSEVGGVMFAVGSFSKTGAGCETRCWDVTPNGGYLIHDYTAPEFSALGLLPEFTFEPQIPITWRATDRGLSGLSRATVIASNAGSGKWRSIATKRSAGRNKVTVPAVQGSHTMFRVVAQDGARNVTRSGVVVTKVPFDQANPDGPGTFSGTWIETPGAYYGDSIHTSTTPLDSLAFPRKGNTYCVFAEWSAEPGRATLEAGGETVTLTSDTVSTPGFVPYCVSTPDVAEQTATLTVQTGRLSVDGYWAGIDGEWTRTGTLRPRATADEPVAASSLPLLRKPHPSLRALRAAARR